MSTIDYRKFIKDLRKKKKWTVKDLADFCRVSPGTIQNWECGFRKPSGSAMKLMENVDKLK